MHPLLGSPRRLRIFLLAWLPVGAALGLLPLWWSGGATRDWWAVVLWGETFAVPMLASAYVCRSAPLSTAGLARVFATIGFAAAISAAAWLEVGRLWFWIVSPVASSPRELYLQIWPHGFAGATVLFVAMAAIHYTIAASDERQAAMARVLEAGITAREAELRALRAQVDPHFLFNCLHSISSLIGSDPVLARTMCIELAAFFRESLRAGGQSRITLAKEAELIERYFDIERLRFGNRLTTSVAVAADAEQALVPPLLLQPLAENAIRHGIATLIEGGDVTIAVTRRGDRIDVVVANPFDADGRRKGTGVGLANVRARLESSYDGRATLTVRDAGSRFHAAISLPLEEAS